MRERTISEKIALLMDEMTFQQLPADVSRKVGSAFAQRIVGVPSGDHEYKITIQADHQQ
ncbi:MAG: hypothetical protein V1766_07590 [Pseudomonadota bacterium]